jgi:hypothetical protein
MEIDERVGSKATRRIVLHGDVSKWEAGDKGILDFSSQMSGRTARRVSCLSMQTVIFSRTKRKFCAFGLLFKHKHTEL